MKEKVKKFFLKCLKGLEKKTIPATFFNRSIENIKKIIIWVWNVCKINKIKFNNPFTKILI